MEAEVEAAEAALKSTASKTLVEAAWKWKMKAWTEYLMKAMFRSIAQRHFLFAMEKGEEKDKAKRKD